MDTVLQYMDTVLQYMDTPFLFKVAAILFFSFILSLAANFLLRKIRDFPKKADWIKAVESSLSTYLKWGIWGLGLLVACEMLFDHYALSNIADGVAVARNVFLIVGTTILIFSAKRKYEKTLIQRVTSHPNPSYDRSLIVAIGKLLSIIISVIAGLMIMDTLGIHLTALLAVGGIGGLAISWAGKDIVANFFGGFTIFINQPFSVGDWIRSPNKGFEGTVETIGWYMTRIVTFDKRPMYIPNAVITDAIIENPSRMYNRRIKETIGLRYEDSHVCRKIAQEIEEMLRNHPDIDQKQTLMVHFVAFGPHSLDLEIYTFTKTTNWAEWREIQQDVFLKTIEIVHTNNADIAFPTSTLYVQTESSEPSHEPKVSMSQKHALADLKGSER